MITKRVIHSPLNKLILRLFVVRCGLKQFFLSDVLSQKGERCICNPGFLGQSCLLGFHNDSGAGQWWRVSEGNPHTPPRTGSAGVYLSSTGAMYLFGGEILLISTDVILRELSPSSLPFYFSCSSSFDFYWLVF